MKTAYLWICGMVFIACQPLQNTSDEPSDNITEQDAMDLLETWEQAMLNKDSALLGEVLHPSYQYAGSPDGSTANRAAMMEWVVSDPNELLSQTFYDMDVKIYGDIAIVRGWEIMLNRSPEGDTSQFRLRFTDVYQKQNEITRALSTHSSPME